MSELKLRPPREATFSASGKAHLILIMMHLRRAEESAGKYGNSFLQGLKPIDCRSFTPGLKPRPPKEKPFFRKL